MRKKFLWTILAAALFSTLFTVTAYAENAVVTGENVNLRSGPGMNYQVIEIVSRGDSLTVEDRSNDEWYAVTYNGIYGFISANLVSITENPSAVKVVATDGFGRINSMYVRFRSGPSGDASIVGEYNVGKELTITGVAGDWTECFIDGQRGYVLSEYVNIETNGAVSVIDVPQSGNGSQANAVQAAPATPAPTKKPEATPAPTPAPASAAAPVITSTGNKPGYVDGDYVSFRSGPSNNSPIINTYNRGKELTITGTSGDWYQVSLDGQTGFIFSSYVKATSSSNAASNAAQPSPTPVPRKGDAGYITGNHVQFRTGPSMTSKNLGEFFYGDAVTIYGTSGDWSEISYKDTTGYVFTSYVTKGTFKTESPKVKTGEKITGREVADFALLYVGYNYRWGGASPATGFDCSGFTSYVYKQFGYELDRVACDQAKNGKAVAADKLQPGDVLCFYSSGSYIGHVGIYIGDNMFVHAANSSSGVITSSLSGYYAARGYVARRIL